MPSDRQQQFEACERFFSIDELVVLVFESTSPIALANCQQVCRKWNAIIQESGSMQERLLIARTDQIDLSSKQQILLKEYLQSTVRPQTIREVNILMLGAGGVGKECLSRQFTYRSFMEQYNPTWARSTTVQTIQIHGEAIRVEWMPFSVRPLQTNEALVSTIMKAAEACILAYSTTSRQSFETMQEMHRRCMASQTEPGRQPHVFLVVATKGDLAELGDNIGHLEGRRFANSIGALFWATSAKEDIGTAPSDVANIVSRVLYRRAVVRTHARSEVTTAEASTAARKTLKDLPRKPHGRWRALLRRMKG